MSNLRVFPATDLHLLQATSVDLQFFAVVPGHGWLDLLRTINGSATTPERLSTQAIVARSADGSYHTISARALACASAPAAPPLFFDDVEDVA